MLFQFTAMQPASPGSKRLLYLAGVFNLAAALSLVLLSRLAPALLGVDPLGASQLLFVDLFAALVLSFGLGYTLGGHDLPRFWPFVALGIIGKLAVVIVVWGYFAFGATSSLTAAMAMGDAFFAALFYRMLQAHTLKENR